MRATDFILDFIKRISRYPHLFSILPLPGHEIILRFEDISEEQDPVLGPMLVSHFIDTTITSSTTVEYLVDWVFEMDRKEDLNRKVKGIDS